MKDDIAISVKNVTKEFRVPHERYSSLKQSILNTFSPKSYSKFISVSDVSFDVKKGEFFGIVGRNGCGKSTLLKMIAGIYTTNKGNIQVNGTLSPFIELGVGFNPELTGRENIFLSGTILGMKKKIIEQKYKKIVEFSELEDFMDQKLKNYSSGMHVRLAFSIAVQAQSDIMLIDEVLAVGDAAFQAKCLDYFVQLKKEKKTIVFVSHDMASIKRFCDRAVYIKDGKAAILGKPIEVANSYSMDNFVNIKNDEKISKRKDKDIYIKHYSVKKQSVTQKEQIEVELTVMSKLTKKVAVAFSFVREDNIYIAGYNSTSDIKDLELKKGINKFKCIVEKGQLTKARYSINIAIFDLKNFGLIDAFSAMQTVAIIDGISTNDGTFNIIAKWKTM